MGRSAEAMFLTVYEMQGESREIEKRKQEVEITLLSASYFVAC
jgi:hypothetical protein